MNFILQGCSLLASHPIKWVTGRVLIREGKMSVPEAKKKTKQKPEPFTVFFDSSEAQSILATKPNHSLCTYTEQITQLFMCGVCFLFFKLLHEQRLQRCTNSVSLYREGKVHICLCRGDELSATSPRCPRQRGELSRPLAEVIYSCAKDSKSTIIKGLIGL